MAREHVSDRKGLQLPFNLQQELGVRNGPSQGNARRQRSAIATRKAQRQAMRKPRKFGDESTVKDDEIKHTHRQSHTKGPRRKVADSTFTRSTQNSGSISSLQTPRSILRKPSIRDVSPISESSQGSRSSSPGLVLDATSKTYKERSAQDEAEIELLEKRLGLKKRKTKQTGDDMLDYLLEGLDDTDPALEQKQSSQAWLSSKRRKLAHHADSDGDIMSGDVNADSDEEDQSDVDEEDTDEASLEDDMSNASVSSDALAAEDSLSDEDNDDGFSGFGSSDENETEPEPKPKIRENPYVAPTVPGASTAKYVPPSLRHKSTNDEESMSRLRKQVQGCLNKLSEANLISILSEIEVLYRSNARQDVTTTLIDLLLSTFCNPSALQNTFIILHAAFIAALYKVMGTDFGAEMLVSLVERIDNQTQSPHAGKQTLNLISLLANLFTFGMISSNIVYDYIRLLLSDFNESNAELLLRIVRDCGPQLRSDDPSALKGIVQMVQTISGNLAKKGQQLNVRTRVMIDTITDLKNNKMKSAANAAGMTGEHITRMRKTLGSMNTRTLKATEPLRITKQDIESSDKKGKWWLVGASWKGNDKSVQPAKDDLDGDITEPTEQEVDFLALSRQYRMNTDVRRSIFVAIMSAEDIRDAQLRLLKLRLTSKQEQEIAKVLLRCTRAEPVYNPYYALLAKNLCKENRKLRIGLQFGLWAFFNAIGEAADDEDSDAETEDQDIGMNEIVNIAKMFAYLIFHNHLTLGALKTLHIGFLKEKATMFLEILLISIMTQPTASEETLIKVFGRAADTPQVVKSLQYFITKHVRRSDLVSKTDRKKVKEGCKIAEVAFAMINSAEMQLD